jgi:hypothetical protein
MTEIEVAILLAVAVAGLIGLIIFTASLFKTDKHSHKTLERLAKEDHAFIKNQFYNATHEILRESARHQSNISDIPWY